VKLKLDENLGRSAAAIFTAAGHDTSTVGDQGLSGGPDHQVAEVSRRERRCLVTLDLDFANPLVFPPEDTSGIAVLRLPPRPAPADLEALCRTLTGALETTQMEGRLWIVQPGRIRVYGDAEGGR
jgi:predicted nuclease of predicted toxin-antitoxin system